MRWVIRHLPLLLSAIVVGSMLAFGFWPVPIEVELGRVTRGQLLATVADEGEARVKEKYVVSAPVNGNLRRMTLHAGDDVTAGVTVLAWIGPGDPELLDARTVAQAEAKVYAADAMVSQSRMNLKHHQELLQVRQHEHERARELIASRAISQSAVDSAEHLWRSAQAQVAAAEFATRIAEFELEQARAALMRSQDTTAAGAELTIPSPIDGVVLKVLHEDAGAVAIGTPLLEIGDPRNMEMRIDLLSTDAVRVRTGARVLVDRWGGDNVLEGVVRVIEPSAFLKVSALGVEEKRVSVIADFTTPYEQRRQLGDGYRIEAAVVVSEHRDVVKAPAGALFRHEDQWAAFAVSEGRAALRVVEIGDSNDEEAHILSGVADGDILILYPTESVRHGVRVTPLNAPLQ